MRTQVHLIIFAMTAGLLQSCDAGTTGFGLNAEESSEADQEDEQERKSSSSGAGARRTSGGGGDNSSSPDIIEPQDVVGAYLACFGTHTIDGVTYQCALHDSGSTRSLRPSVLQIDSVRAQNVAGDNLTITVTSTDAETASTADFIVTVANPNAIALRTISARYSFEGGLKESFLSQGTQLQPLRFGYMFPTRDELTGYEANTAMSAAVCKTEAEAARLPGASSFRPLLPSADNVSVIDLLVGREWHSTASNDPLPLLTAEAVRVAVSNGRIPDLSATLEFGSTGVYSGSQNMYHWTFLTSAATADFCELPGATREDATVGERFSPENWLISKGSTSNSPDSNGGWPLHRKSCRDRLPIICISGPDTSSPPAWVDPSQP